MDLEPINGCVLVKLTESYAMIDIPDKKYDTKTSGILLKAAKHVTLDGFPITDLIGKKVYFESYKDDTVKQEDGEKYALIKATELKGYENAEPSA